jgi:hypothetical protein
MSEVVMKLGGGRATRTVEGDSEVVEHDFGLEDRDEIDEQAAVEVSAAAVGRLADALNVAIFEAVVAGLRVEIETDAEKIFDSPHQFPFQRVSVWQGDKLLSSVHLPGREPGERP